MQNDVYNSHPYQCNEADFISWIIHVDMYFVLSIIVKNIVVMIKTNELGLFSLHSVIKNHVHESRRYICPLSFAENMNTHSLLNIHLCNQVIFMRGVTVKYILWVGFQEHKRGCILLSF